MWRKKTTKTSSTKTTATGHVGAAFSSWGGHGPDAAVRGGPRGSMGGGFHSGFVSGLGGEGLTLRALLSSSKNAAAAAAELWRNYDVGPPPRAPPRRYVCHCPIVAVRATPRV